MVHRSMSASSRHEVDDLLQSPGQGRQEHFYRSTNNVSQGHRIRAASQTRNTTKMLEVNYELFQWWVDMAETLQARVPTMSVIAQAQLLIEDAQAYVDDCMRRGEIPPLLKIPRIYHESGFADGGTCLV